MWKVSEGTPEERAQQIEQFRKVGDEKFKIYVQYLEDFAKEFYIPMPDYAKVSGALLLSIVHGYSVNILSSS